MCRVPITYPRMNLADVRLANITIGPELTTCGPWRPIVLEEYSSKVSDLSCQIKVDMDTKTAVVKIAIQSEGCVAGDTISVSITDPKGDVIHEVCNLPINGNHAYADIEIQDAQFWWPIGYGHQPLYTVSSDLFTRVSMPMM